MTGKEFDLSLDGLLELEGVIAAGFLVHFKAFFALSCCNNHDLLKNVVEL